MVENYNRMAKHLDSRAILKGNKDINREAQK